MSLPGPGVLLVTMGSNAGSKNIGPSRPSSASSVSPSRVGMVAPAFVAARAAAASASGVHSRTNLRAV